MDEFFTQVWTIISTLADPRNLTHPEAFKAALNQPGVFGAAMFAVTFIVFAETGLLFGFLFPGDSLLVVLGVVARLSDWNVWLLVGCLSAAAIIGEMVGYWIGAKAGPAIFNRPDGRFFKQRYLTDAQNFFKQYGPAAIVVARFMPFVRTFVPVIAGAAKMNYRSFMIYNVIGGILWIFGLVLLGYYLLNWIDHRIQRNFDLPDFTLAKHLDKIIIVVVFLSIAPMLWKGYHKWRASRNAASQIVSTGITNEAR
ncbi:hypothetical protein BH11PLA2_BH11PLA2_03260 [soil metagenome]